MIALFLSGWILQYMVFGYILSLALDQCCLKVPSIQVLNGSLLLEFKPTLNNQRNFETLCTIRGTYPHD